MVSVLEVEVKLKLPNIQSRTNVITTPTFNEHRKIKGQKDCNVYSFFSSVDEQIFANAKNNASRYPLMDQAIIHIVSVVLVVAWSKASVMNILFY